LTRTPIASNETGDLPAWHRAVVADVVVQKFLLAETELSLDTTGHGLANGDLAAEFKLSPVGGLRDSLTVTGSLSRYRVVPVRFWPLTARLATKRSLRSEPFWAG
jgi:hypothetical protein